MTPLADLADIVDLVLPTPSDSPITPRDRGRALAGHFLELSARLVAPSPVGDDDVVRGPVRKGVDLVQRFWPTSLDSHRSIWSSQSMYSAVSVSSFGSVGSVFSAFSAGSILCVGSAGSILSIGSVGSVLSIGSAGSMLGIGAAGQRQPPGTHPADALAATSEATMTKVVHVAATTLAVGALASAVLKR